MFILFPMIFINTIMLLSNLFITLILLTPMEYLINIIYKDIEHMVLLTKLKDIFNMVEIQVFVQKYYNLLYKLVML
jgi:hypothetical protein